MATTFTSAQAASTIPAKRSGGTGVVHCAYGVYEIAVNPTAADVYELCRVPPNARIVGGWFYMDDIDTNASETIDIDIGWAANGGSGTFDSADSDGLGNLGVMNGDAFANPSVSSSVGNVVPFSGVLADGDCPKFTAETVIQAQCVATAATFAAGALSVVVFYIIEGAAS